MQSVKMIEDPEALKVLADDTRRKMVSLLRVKEMTVSQIAAELGVTVQTVYHHVRKLVNGGMVEVSREERIDHLIESYYRATAERFIFRVGASPQFPTAAKDQIIAVLDGLKKLGFKIEMNEEKISQLADLQVEINRLHKYSDFVDAVSKLDDVDFAAKQDVCLYAGLLSMSDDEYARKQEISNKFRDLLRSLVQN